MAIVETAYGKVEGVERGRHHAFLGIPFAAPPVGARRWRAAEPPEPWTGVRAAREFGLSARQTTHPIGGFAASGPQDEDCLYLDVYTPAPDGAKRPVLFWIHGGGFTHGSGSEPLYNGRAFAERGDCVLVAIHYRLGAFGFASFLDHVEAGRGVVANAGLTDMVQALRWTRENIAAFGGDPGNVTIFGESAGSGAVGSLLSMPSALGLFQRAVMESGAGLQTGSRAGAAKATDLLLEQLGLTKGTAAKAWDVSADALLEAQTAAIRAGAGFRPCVDGQVLPVNPYTHVRNGGAAAIDYVVGSNRDEVKLFNAARDRQVDDTALLEGARQSLAGAFGRDAATREVSDDEARHVIEVHQRSRRDHGLSTSNVDILDAVATNVRFTVPSTRWALAQREAQAKAGRDPSARLYLFTWESPARRGILGSCHALEMPFVFHTLDAPTQDRFAGVGPEAERLAAQMNDAWIQFARTGNPAHEGVGEWPCYDGASRTQMVFGRESGPADDPFREERECIEEFATAEW